MARVTVEDCLKHVKNRFELVIIASKRARQLMRGKEPRVPWDNDKSTVVALREIAEGYVDFDTKEVKQDDFAAFTAKATEFLTPAPVPAPVPAPATDTASDPAPEITTPKSLEDEQ